MGLEFLKSAMFQRFAVDRPVAVMTHMDLSHLLVANSLQRVFVDNAQQQYERTPDQWECFARMSSTIFASSLAAVAAKMDPHNYRKSIRGPKKPQVKKKHEKQSVHVSTKNILDQRRASPC
jgi:hypothetical protein